MDESSLDLTLKDEDGVPVINVISSDRFPDEVRCEIESKNDLAHVSQLASEVFKGSIGTSGRTVELVFLPHIQKGLKDGTFRMMGTKGGETLADVVDTTGKIAGKGRIVSKGQLRQLATGSYQLVSLIVAQSHLADITKNLNDIKISVNLLHEKIENKKLAEIQGRIKYLEGLISKFNRGDFGDDTPQQIKTAIELTVQDAHGWQALLFNDLATALKNIRDLKDSDTFGTGGSYKELKKRTDATIPLLGRRRALLQFAVLLSGLQACIDPLAEDFSSFDIDSPGWNAQLEELAVEVNKQCNALLTKARFNSDETLELRRFHITQSVQGMVNEVSSIEDKYQLGLMKLHQRQRHILSESGKFRLAVAFNEQGNVERAAVVD